MHKHHLTFEWIATVIKLYCLTITIAYRSSYQLENSSITRSIFLPKNKERGGTMKFKKIKKKREKREAATSNKIF